MDVLGDHGDEAIWALFGDERHVSEPASVRDDRDRRDGVRRVEERSDQARHVEDFERPGKDRERFGMFRLRGACLEESPPEASAGAFICQEQAHGAGADDHDIRVDCGMKHDLILID